MEPIHGKIIFTIYSHLDLHGLIVYEKKKTNHPISSNRHPSATAHKAKYCLKCGAGIKPTGTSYNSTEYEAGHPTAVSENNSLSGMYHFISLEKTVIEFKIVACG